jgi:hypothetical protein
MKDRVSKRILGFCAYVVGLGLAIATGFDGYDVDSMIILAVLGNGTAALGIDAYNRNK